MFVLQKRKYFVGGDGLVGINDKWVPEVSFNRVVRFNTSSDN